MNAPNLEAVFNRNTNYIAGIKKRFAGSPAIVLGGISYTPGDVELLFQKQIDAGKALTPAEAQYHAAVTAYRAATAEAHPVALRFEQYVRLQFGDDETALADFGLQPRKARAPKPATKAAAATKRKETRELRGTKGKKQRKAIKAGPATQPTAPKS